MPGFLAALPAIAQLATTAFSAFSLFGGGRKRPKRPEFPTELIEGGGISAEEKERLLGSLRRRIERNRNQNIEDIRTTAAGRGGLRSGLVPQLEAKITSGAEEQFSEAVTSVELAEAGRRSELRLKKFGFEQRNFEAELEEFLSGLDLAGSNFGASLSDLGDIDFQSLIDLFGGGGGSRNRVVV